LFIVNQVLQARAHRFLDFRDMAGVAAPHHDLIAVGKRLAEIVHE
jgi:hypothetical protein